MRLRAPLLAALLLALAFAQPAAAGTVRAQDGQCAYTDSWWRLTAVYSELGPAACASLEVERNGNSWSYTVMADARDIPGGNYLVSWCVTIETVQVIITPCEGPVPFCWLGECRYGPTGADGGGYGLRSVCGWVEITRDGQRVAHASACA